MVITFLIELILLRHALDGKHNESIIMTKKQKEEEIARKARVKIILEGFEKRKKACLKARKAQGLCNAVLCHGPGHQTKTFCQCKGKHTKHKAEYGRYNEVMEWKGMKAFTGYFDEPV